MCSLTIECVYHTIARACTCLTDGKLVLKSAYFVSTIPRGGEVFTLHPEMHGLSVSGDATLVQRGGVIGSEFAPSYFCLEVGESTE